MYVTVYFVIKTSMALTESFDRAMTQCPLEGIDIECPVLARDFDIAQEPAAGLIMNAEQHASDSSTHRIIMLMRGAAGYMKTRPCKGCPNKINQ